MITAEIVNQRYDALVAAFNELARIEDEMQEHQHKLSDLKEGSPSAANMLAKIQKRQGFLFGKQRAYRLAAMEVDRTAKLLEVERIAAG